MNEVRSALHILVVDDEESVQTLLKECFELDGYRVSVASGGEQLAALLRADPPDLITLDLKLGGENGLELARRIRESRNIPIVMITGKSDTIDRVVGLELGADDYIGKPFHVREVLARVRAVLRRYQGTSAAPSDSGHFKEHIFGDWRLNVGRRELKSTSGRVQDLTTAEFNMLEMFLARPTRVLSRDNIMDLLKGHEWSPYDRSIDALVVRLRRKIEADPEEPRMIKTVRGVGYVFTAEVRNV
jgi:DNA-binding response OmpR family regulator